MLQFKTLELLITVEYRALQAMIACYCGNQYNYYSGMDSYPRHYRAMQYVTRAIAKRITELGNLRNLHLIPELTQGEMVDILRCGD